MEQQQELKQQVLYLINFYGTTQQFIATNINVSRSTINLWLKGERVLALPVEQRLIMFLEQRIK
jgi:transcriptional regulator with XRE-family HTH domain